MSKNIYHNFLRLAGLLIVVSFLFSSCSDDDNEQDTSNGAKLLPAQIETVEGDSNVKLNIAYDAKNRISTLQKDILFAGNNAAKVQSRYLFSYNSDGQISKLDITEGATTDSEFKIIQTFEYKGNTVNVAEQFLQKEMTLTFHYALTLNDKQQLTKLVSEDAMQYFEFLYDGNGNLTESVDYEIEGSETYFKSEYVYDTSINGIFVNVEMPAWYFAFNGSYDLKIFGSPNAVAKHASYAKDEEGLHQEWTKTFSLEKNESGLLSKMTSTGGTSGNLNHTIEYLEGK